MRNVGKKVECLVAALVVMSLVAACGNVVGPNGSSDPNGDPNGTHSGLRLVGNVPGGVGASIVPAFSNGPSGSYELWALPLVRQKITEEGLSSDALRIEAFSEGEDFSVDLDTSEDYVLLLVDAEAGDDPESRMQSVRGYLAVPAEGDGDLVFMPSSYASADTVDLGSLEHDAEKGLLRGETDINQLQQSISGVNLSEIVGLDDNFRFAETLYANYDQDAESWWRVLYIGFDWQPSFDLVKNKLSDPMDYDKDYDDGDNPFENTETGYALFVDLLTNSTDGSEGIMIHFDEGVKVDDGGIENVTELEPVDFEPDDYGDDVYRINLISGAGIRSIPDMFSVKDGDETLARFSVGLSDPFDADGRYRTFVPSVRVDIDEEGTDDGTLTGYEIQWKRWNGEEYVDVDPDVFSHLIVEYEVKIGTHKDHDNRSIAYESGWVSEASRSVDDLNENFDDNEYALSILLRMSTLEYEWNFGDRL